MSVRLPELQLLPPADLLRAAERILAHPTCNVQRVSMDEVFSFAVATTQLAEICGLAGRHVAGLGTAADLQRLRDHLTGLAAGFDLPRAAQKDIAHG